MEERSENRRPLWVLTHRRTIRGEGTEGPGETDQEQSEETTKEKETSGTIYSLETGTRRSIVRDYVRTMC